jgi:hypothetical protein
VSPNISPNTPAARRPLPPGRGRFLRPPQQFRRGPEAPTLILRRRCGTAAFRTEGAVARHSWVRVGTNVETPLASRAVGSDEVAGFSALARVGNACLGGPAVLYVRGDGVELVPGFSLSRPTGVERIVQHDPQVQMFRPRLAAPWVNTTVIVTGDGFTGAASVWVTGRRCLKRALLRAGFDVREKRTWIYRGDDLVRGGRAGLPSDDGMPAD